jgi:N-formylglutamate deformylase
MPGWLNTRRGNAPLIVSFPHTGTEIPHDIEVRLASPWLGRKDTDWWVHDLYDFVHDLDVTTVRTSISRTVIDVNRDPSGASLYPGQATTELCPTATFDGEALYLEGGAPSALEIVSRRKDYFDPYHAALSSELQRLLARHDRVVLYEAHSIRTYVPRLFDGALPNFNIGTNSGATCDPALSAAVTSICARSGFTHVVNGRFKGGWTTRHYGEPQRGVHAIQMELACSGYLQEPQGPLTESNWPPPYDAVRAAPMRAALTDIINACLAIGTQS